MGILRSQRLILWLPPAAWMAFIFYLSSQSSFGILSRLSFPGADKLVHAVIYGVLAALTARAVVPGRWSPGWGWLVATSYGMTDEYHQFFVPGRQMDGWDLLADAAGAALAVAALTLIRQRRDSGEPRSAP